MSVTSKTGLIAAAAAFAFGGISAANAETLGFVRISNNSSSNVASQLSVDVTDAGSGQVAFTFYNNVGAAASITDIYFDDGTLLGIASITESAGVAFSQPATPGDLPGGSGADPDFNTTAGFSADSDPPAAQNGVDAASEWVTITFNLINGQNFADTLAALADGTLRIGLHVQALGDGASDAYINNGMRIIPLPATAGMAGVGLLLLGARRRR